MGIGKHARILALLAVLFPAQASSSPPGITIKTPERTDLIIFDCRKTATSRKGIHIFAWNTDNTTYDIKAAPGDKVVFYRGPYREGQDLIDAEANLRQIGSAAPRKCRFSDKVGLLQKGQYLYASGLKKADGTGVQFGLKYIVNVD